MVNPKAKIDPQAQREHDALGPAVFETLYLKTQGQLRRLWFAIWVLLALVSISVLMLFTLGREGKVDPIVVKVDGHNQILDVEQAAHINYHSLMPSVATYFVERFVSQARSVSIDGQWQQVLMQNAYAMTQGAATNTLHDFYVGRDPMKTAAHAVIAVAIDNIIPYIGGSRHTTQVEWTETTRDPKTGKVLDQQTYTGQFTFHWGKPAGENSVTEHNPLGFYITNIAWAANVAAPTT